jgi:hypothetical protein
MKAYRFIKEGSEWYIDLPDYIETGGSKGDLQMVEGADSMLEIMCRNGQDVTLLMDRKEFADADVLTLTEKCDPLIGGGYYRLHTYEGRSINKDMWLCAVTEYVFGDLPEKIYVKAIY